MRPFSSPIDSLRPSRSAWRLAPAVLASMIAVSGVAVAQGVAPPGYGFTQGQGQYGQDYGQPPGDPSGNPLGDPNNAALAADPSSRVATLTDAAGNISFAPAGSDTWAATGLNRPVTTGDRLWVDPGGRAELHAGSTAVRLAGATAVSVLNLDDDTTQVKLTQGTLQLRVRALPQGQTVEVDTPNLAFVPTEVGDYRLDVAPDGSATTVTMRHGRAVLYGDNRSSEMERGERIRFTGTDLDDAGAGNLAPTDAFDRWVAERDAREDRSVAAQYVPRDMTGYTALDDYGDWQQDPDYGAMWFPRAVSPDWAPYSVGQWAWVAPWGWTWVDDAPWGFAPSHYGRWAHVGSRWGWVPGPANVRPYYAPAVVGFIGGGSTQIRIGGGPGVAWYPLGPGERYRPIYRSSPTYLSRINRGPVREWNGRGDRDRWFNRGVPGAISGMPARGFVEGRPAAPYRGGTHAEEWRRIPGGEVHGGPAIAPVKNSLIGGAPVRNLPPQARQTFDREAIAARAPGRMRTDDLARRFAREGGTAGAGPAWRGPQTPDTRQPGRAPQPVAQYSDVRISQAAQRPRDRQSQQGFVAAPGADNSRSYSTRPDQMRGLPAEAQRQQQAMQRQQFEQQRQLQEQQRQQPDFQRQQQQALQRQQFDQQRQLQDQQRQPQDFQRQQQQALQRQQFEQQQQLQEMQRQSLDMQRQTQQALQRQQMEQQRQLGDQQAATERARQDQQRAFAQQRQQQDDQRAAQQRAQADQQRAQGQQRQQQDQQRAAMQRAQADQQRAQDMQRQQQDQQRAAQQRAQADQQRALDQQRQQQDQQRAAMQRAQADQQRAQDMQRQQQEQQRAAMQRAQADQQRALDMQRQQQSQQQAAMQRAQQEQQRAQQEQQRQMSMQRQQQEQQRQAFEQQRQQQQQQLQHQQQQQQQQQRQFQQQRGQQARNDDRR